MLTPLYFPFLVLGAIWFKKGERESWFLFGAILCTFLLVFLSPQKVTDHDFYLYATFPFLAILAACGIQPLYEQIPALRKRPILALLLLLSFAVSSRYFAHPIFKTPDGEANYEPAARAVRNVTNPQDRIIVFGQGTAVMVYYSDREVWTMDPNTLGGELAYYLKNPSFRKADMREISRLEYAMKNYVTWFEYLKGMGASYFVAHDRNALEGARDLEIHLKQNHELVSSPEDLFYLFKIQ